MRFALLLTGLCLCISLASQGQKITVHNGKVLVDGTLYCLYQEHNVPAQKNNTLSPSQRLGGQRETGDFNDMRVSAPDGEELVVVKARVLAAPGSSYLSEYYCIKLLPVGKEIDIIRKPYELEYFLKDLVKYHVFVRGEWDDDNARALFEGWEKKDGIIPYAAITGGTGTDYNVQHDPTVHVTDDNDIEAISIKGSQIYRNDSLIANYKETIYNYQSRRMAAKTSDRYYIIYNAKGEQLASLQLMPARSQSYLWIGNERQALSLVSADKHRRR